MGLKKIKKRLPWWIKIISKLIFSRLSFLGYGFWKRIGLFEHGRMNLPEYAEQIFLKHYNLAKKPKSFCCLEMGNGDSLSTAINAWAYGATKTYMVDVGFFANTDIEIYKNLTGYLNKKDFKLSENFENYEQMLQEYNAVYLTEGLKSLKEIPSESIDFIFSQAVLEHVWSSEFEQTMIELHRILKKEGISTHVIDLKDHLEYSLNNLRFKEKTWESRLFKSSGFYTNRIRKHEMLDLFEKVGFNINIVEETKWEKLPINKKKMAKPFRDLNKEQLLTSNFTVILSK